MSWNDWRIADCFARNASFQRGSAPQDTPQKSTSGELASLFRCHRIRRAKWRRTPRTRPCRVNLEASFGLQSAGYE
eukprot:15466488-Alexandrium_andersonii.AAC.1